EFTGADSSSVIFHSATGELILDHSADFTGTISGFSGDGTLTGSDLIDLRDINFSSLEQSSYAHGVLTVSDGTHTANLDFNGDYQLANFKFVDDSQGGTTVYDPPVTGGSAPTTGDITKYAPADTATTDTIATDRATFLKDTVAISNRTRTRSRSRSQIKCSTSSTPRTTGMGTRLTARMRSAPLARSRRKLCRLPWPMQNPASKAGRIPLPTTTARGAPSPMGCSKATAAMMHLSSSRTWATPRAGTSLRPPTAPAPITRLPPTSSTCWIPGATTCQQTRRSRPRPTPC